MRFRYLNQIVSKMGDFYLENKKTISPKTFESKVHLTFLKSEFELIHY